VQVGEESGSLPSVLDRTADYYERRVDSLLTTLTSVMEPALIIVVGAIVLVTVLALYLPIFQISDIRK
jgi:type IV pilus assembly protein PilC